MKRARPRHTQPRPRAVRRATREKTSPVRIVVADSQAIDRGGLVGLLEDEPDFEVVGEAATVPEEIRQCTALKPDVLVLSLNLPGQQESAAIPSIRAALPKLRILALSERGAENCLGGESQRCFCTQPHLFAALRKSLDDRVNKRRAAPR